MPIRAKGAPVQYTIIGLLAAEPDVARFHLRRRGPVAFRHLTGAS